MSLEKEFTIDDLPKLDVTAAVQSKEVNLDRYDEILEKIENPNCSVATISRLISVEIAKATRDMAAGMGDPSNAWKSKAYSEHIKALRELSKQLTETEVLSKKDMLNFDGPKFLHTLKEIAKLYKQALKDAGCEPALIENAIKHFADLMSVNDARLRREIDQMEIGK
jgi:hypothetical protein